MARVVAGDLADDALDLIEGASRRIDLRAPELGRPQMPAAEHVQRQIAIAIVVAVEEPALLMPMQGIIGGVEVDIDVHRRPLMGIEEQLDKQPLDRRAVVVDLVVAART